MRLAATRQPAGGDGAGELEAVGRRPNGFGVDFQGAAVTVDDAHSHAEPDRVSAY